MLQESKRLLFSQKNNLNVSIIEIILSDQIKNTKKSLTDNESLL